VGIPQFVEQGTGLRTHELDPVEQVFAEMMKLPL
jgi:hypothetical protein